MQLLKALLPLAAELPTGLFDKIGFDLDVIGRQREIASIEEKARLKHGTEVNIAVWNMHVPETHNFKNIIESQEKPMGRGGGFRIVVFRGQGHFENHGALGLDNWRCSGNVVQRGNQCRFSRAAATKGLWNSTTGAVLATFLMIIWGIVYLRRCF